MERREHRAIKEYTSVLANAWGLLPKSVHYDRTDSLKGEVGRCLRPRLYSYADGLTVAGSAPVMLMCVNHVPMPMRCEYKMHARCQSARKTICESKRRRCALCV